MSQEQDIKKTYYSYLSQNALDAAKKIEQNLEGLSISEVEQLLYAVKQTLKEKTKV